jgi:hypothetical protein
MPQVLGQTTTTQASLIPEVEVGLSAYSVTLDGQVTDEEWVNDTNPYPYLMDTGFPGSPGSGKPLEGYLRAKRGDEWTYLGARFPTSTDRTKMDFQLLFDTRNTGKKTPGANGVYFLYLVYDPTLDKTDESTPIIQIGTQFKNAFTRGKDYDWAYHFPPSEFEFKVHNEIIWSTVNGNQTDNIGFSTLYAKAGAISIPDLGKTPWARLVRKDSVLPEPTLLPLAISASVVGVTAIKMARSKGQLSRREFLQLSRKFSK